MRQSSTPIHRRSQKTTEQEDHNKTWANEFEFMDSFDNHCDKALYLYNMDRYQDALHEIRAAIAIHPTDPWLLTLASECFRMLGMSKQALFTARYAFEQDPENLLCHIFLCKALCAEERFGQELVDCAERILESFPNQIGAYAIAAEAYLKLHWYEKALATTELGLKLEPGHEKCLFRRAEALFKLMRFKEAKDCLLTLIESNPENFEAYYRLGWEEYQAGNLRDAEQMFVNALEIEPEYSKALEGLKLVQNLLR